MKAGTRVVLAEGTNGCLGSIVPALSKNARTGKSGTDGTFTSLRCLHWTENGLRSVCPHVVPVVMSAPASCVHAASAGAGAITMRISPEHSVTPLHQPLDVVLLVQNSSAQAAEIDLGDDRKRNLVLTVTSPDGKERTLRLAEHEGLARMGRIEVQAGETYSQHLILNEWMEFAAVGIYRIVVRFREPIKLHDGTVAELGPSELLASITDQNSEALTDFCRKALQGLLNAKTYADAQQAAQALSYTEDPVRITLHPTHSFTAAPALL